MTVLSVFSIPSSKSSAKPDDLTKKLRDEVDLEKGNGHFSQESLARITTKAQCAVRLEKIGRMISDNTNSEKALISGLNLDKEHEEENLAAIEQLLEYLNTITRFLDEGGLDEQKLINPELKTEADELLSDIAGRLVAFFNRILEYKKGKQHEYLEPFKELIRQELHVADLA